MQHYGRLGRSMHAIRRKRAKIPMEFEHVLDLKAQPGSSLTSVHTTFLPSYVLRCDLDKDCHYIKETQTLHGSHEYC